MRGSSAPRQTNRFEARDLLLGETQVLRVQVGAGAIALESPRQVSPGDGPQQPGFVEPRNAFREAPRPTPTRLQPEHGAHQLIGSQIWQHLRPRWHGRYQDAPRPGNTRSQLMRRNAEPRNPRPVCEVHSATGLRLIGRPLPATTAIGQQRRWIDFNTAHPAPSHHARIGLWGAALAGLAGGDGVLQAL